MNSAVVPDPIEDERVACQSDLPLLITAATRRDVERLARRIHQGGPRAAGPFVCVRIRAWPSTSRTIRRRWSAAFNAAAGGTVLLADVEDMSPTFQDVFVELIDELHRPHTPAPPPRLISGTTVSLLERVEAGTFSERLFYRLNLIHLLADGVPRTTSGSAGPPVAHATV